MRRALLVTLALLIVVATFFRGTRLGMVTAITTRHAFYSIPCAISRLYFDTGRYVILGDVAEVFMTAHPNISNETLRQSLFLKPRLDRVMLFPADDKGDADFVALSFLIFGLNVEALYYMWFLMFVVPIAVFVAVYWRDEFRLATLCVLLLAVEVGFSALPLTTELFSIHNPRSFGIVSLASVLHLCFAMIDRQRASAGRLPAAAMQAAFIAFSIHVRTTEFWQVLCVLGVASALILRDHSRQAIRTLWPALVLVVAVLGLEIYQRASFDPVYGSTHIRHRIFWHNVGIGFALNPMLARKYALAIDDMPMMQLVRRRLIETNRAAEVYEVFRPPGPNEWNYRYYGIAKDFVRYERVAREVVASIVWNNKLEALKTFVVDKPVVLFRELAWAGGYGAHSIDDLYLTGQATAVASNRTRRQNGIYLDLFNPWICAGMIAVVVLGGFGRQREQLVSSVLALAICCVSLLPAMVAYPIISALGVSLVTVGFLVLAAFALAVQLLATRLYLPRVAPSRPSTVAAVAD